jgi:hypothetical protein
VSNENPELAGYEPYAGKPLRSRRLMWVMRLIVIVGVVSLVLPGIYTTVSVGASNAERACAFRVAQADPSAAGSEARFEVFGPGGLGYECYLLDPFNGDQHVYSLGLIPVAPRGDTVPASNL